MPLGSIQPDYHGELATSLDNLPEKQPRSPIAGNPDRRLVGYSGVACIGVTYTGDAYLGGIVESCQRLR